MRYYPAGRIVGSASSWLLRDGKCPKMARFQPFELKISPRWWFGHAEFSARGPRPRFRAMLMMFGRGANMLGKKMEEHGNRVWDHVR